MTDPELQQLAREYAEQNPPASIKDDILRENAVSLNAEIFYKHLQWLSERYSIIPKATLDKDFLEIAHDYAMYLDPDSKPNREMIANDSIGYLSWVMGKYCIVEKSEITEWINTLEIYMPTKHTKTMLKIGAKSLFGKELFNEEK